MHISSMYVYLITYMYACTFVCMPEENINEHKMYVLM